MRVMEAVLCGAVVLAAGCTAKSTPPDIQTGGTGTGTINVGGASSGNVSYTVDNNSSNLLLESKKGSGSACSFFHHHALGALAVNYTYALDKAAPQSSTFTAEVLAAGLSPDEDSFRNAFPETSGTTVPASEKNDIRTNMLDQLDASNHPTITFRATNLTTLDGDGTADVEVTLRGQVSHFTMNANASWAGDVLTITGSGSIDGAQHGIPTGTFKDCIDPVMPVKMTLTLRPGTGNNSGLDGSVAPFVPMDYADTTPCISDPNKLVYDDVRDVLFLNCVVCHGNPTQFGATVPLRTWEDFHKNSRLHPDGPLFQDSAERLNAADARLMPPASYPMPAAEKMVLEAWFNDGAPKSRCDAQGQPIAPVATPPEDCRTGSSFPFSPNGNYAVGEHMFPGMDCVACHQANGEQAAMVLAGTVFQGLHQQDSCNAFPGSPTTRMADIKVVIDDAAGHSWTLDVYNAGNFMLRNTNAKRLTPPYSAKVINTTTGEERAMVSQQTEGSCNKCHVTQEQPLPAGVSFMGNPPPGRIVAPGVW